MCTHGLEDKCRVHRFISSACRLISNHTAKASVVVVRILECLLVNAGWSFNWEMTEWSGYQKWIDFLIR